MDEYYTNPYTDYTYLYADPYTDYTGTGILGGLYGDGGYNFTYTGDYTTGGDTSGGFNWAQYINPAIQGLGSVASGLLGSNAYNSAAAAQSAAAQQAAQLSQLQYLENVERMAPYYALGLQGVQEVSPLLSNLQPYSFGMYLNSPEKLVQDYATRQAQDQIMSSAAAGGMAGSGNVANALQQKAQMDSLAGYQQGLSNYWGQTQNQLNALQPYIQAGQNAGLNVANLGTSNVTNQINALTGGANAQALGAIGSTQQWQNALSGVGGALQTGLTQYYNPVNPVAAL